MSAVFTEESWRAPDESFRARLGIWIFLATEFMFFGGLFLAYAVLRMRNTQAFIEAGQHASMFFGTLNTGLLVTSSLFMVLALVGHEAGRSRRFVQICLILTLAFGCGFLIAKGFEYNEDIREHLFPGRGFPVRIPAAIDFFSLYWVMTGLHAVHLSIGIAIVLYMLVIGFRAQLPSNYRRALEVTALYWNLIDVIWVMIYPCIYLVGRWQ